MVYILTFQFQLVVASPKAIVECGPYPKSMVLVLTARGYFHACLDPVTLWDFTLWSYWQGASPNPAYR